MLVVGGIPRKTTFTISRLGARSRYLAKQPNLRLVQPRVSQSGHLACGSVLAYTESRIWIVETKIIDFRGSLTIQARVLELIELRDSRASNALDFQMGKMSDWQRVATGCTYYHDWPRWMSESDEESIPPKSSATRLTVLVIKRGND